MLANQHIHEEIEEMEKIRANTKDDVAKAMIKSNILIIKLLHNIRTNMTEVMKSQGINLIKSKTVKTTEEL